MGPFNPRAYPWGFEDDYLPPQSDAYKALKFFSKPGSKAGDGSKCSSLANFGIEPNLCALALAHSYIEGLSRY